MPDIYYINEQIEFNVQTSIVRLSDTDKQITLTPLCARILQILCANANATLSHKEIMTYVWREKYQELQYGTYYQTLLLLRKALKTVGGTDDLIKTVHRKGLVLNGSVETSARQHISAEHSDNKDNSNNSSNEHKNAERWYRTTILGCLRAGLMITSFFLITSSSTITNRVVSRNTLISRLGRQYQNKKTCKYISRTTSIDNNKNKILNKVRYCVIDNTSASLVYSITSKQCVYSMQGARTMRCTKNTQSVQFKKQQNDNKIYQTLQN